MLACAILLIISGLTQYNALAANDYGWREWVEDIVEWRENVAEWKTQVEQNCYISDEDWNWISLFTCPDFSGIDCLNSNAIRHRMDSLNCTIAYCEDGRYHNNTVLRSIYRQQSDLFRRMLAIYKDDLTRCQPRVCPEEATTAVQITEPVSTIQITEPVSTTTASINTTKDVGSVGTIRLVNGAADSEGRVEIFVRGQWGTICDDNWDIKDAIVICRMLGYANATDSYPRAHFGLGTGLIALDEVHCTGEEQSIFECPGNDNHDCSHNEDASVACQI